MPENLKRENSYPACGRLVVLEAFHKGYYDLRHQERYSGYSAINFPAMPDSIELARRTDYKVTSPLGFPDGIHQYMGTAPLEIPLSFELAANDKDYCPRGALSLLQLAAHLESLTLPIGLDTAEFQSGYTADPVAPAIKNGDNSSLLSQADKSYTLRGEITNPRTGLFPPVTCYLELILTETNAPGIACIGYVKEVSAKLMGPFRRGPGQSQNLPTKGEFSFVFVHHPGHGNTYNLANQSAGNIQPERQAFADTVRRQLYNTRDLITSANFKGFSGN